LWQGLIFGNGDPHCCGMPLQELPKQAGTAFGTVVGIQVGFVDQGSLKDISDTVI